MEPAVARLANPARDVSGDHAENDASEKDAKDCREVDRVGDVSFRPGNASLCEFELALQMKRSSELRWLTEGLFGRGRDCRRH